jgi:hypothetical protein
MSDYDKSFMGELFNSRNPYLPPKLTRKELEEYSGLTVPPDEGAVAIECYDKINAKLNEIQTWRDKVDHAIILKHRDLLIAALQRAMEAFKAYRVSERQSLREHAEECERDIARILEGK